MQGAFKASIDLDFMRDVNETTLSTPVSGISQGLQRVIVETRNTLGEVEMCFEVYFGSVQTDLIARFGQRYWIVLCTQSRRFKHIFELFEWRKLFSDDI